MANHDIIVIGASAGGVEALQELVAKLPPSLPAALCAVVHIPPWPETNLAAILNRAGPFPAHAAKNGERIRRGHIYVPPADHHLLLENNQTVISRGPRENRSRPAVDPLFRSAAVAYGPRVIGVVLSGNLDDGTAGLWQIKEEGGITVVQDPKEARFSGMVRSALNNVKIDHVFRLREMGPMLEKLVKTPADGAAKTDTKRMAIENKFAKLLDSVGDVYKLGKPSAFVCPECQGTLFEIEEGKPRRYRCRTGHAYSETSLLAEQINATEDALWAGARALREQADLLKKRSNGHPNGSATRKHLEQLENQAEQQAIKVRDIIEQIGETLDSLEESRR